ncbi:non-specific lipid-transfer protein-like [Mercurialis annua]|uniref:non-specific lipid-transfer protein-like n=1 Tax=Mercurialis annua TaxID=3986 RepID=UPI00215DDFE4|nr:non-specific lipid-transfer protein-like [Mercurialis annua]
MEKKVMMIMGVITVLLVSHVMKSVHAVSCPETLTTIGSCFPFLQGMGSAPPSSCCSGLHKVISGATTGDFRRELCDCLKTAASSYGVLPDKVKLSKFLTCVMLQFLCLLTQVRTAPRLSKKIG